MNSRSFFVELKRRNVYKVAVAYAIVAWVLIQAASILFPTFEAPAWVMKVFVTAVLLGFPVALILAWAFELTPEGIKRAEDAAPSKSITARTGRKLVGITVVLAVIAAGLLAFPFLRPKATAVPATKSAPANISVIPEKSVAVLPFENLSRDPDNAYFATGIQDEILTRLAKIGALKVISRISTQQYAARPGNLSDIAHQLGVANILEGSVQRAADQVHINVQLIRAATDEHLWAESYDRTLENIFRVEAEVATSVAEALKARFTGAEQHALEERPTNNPQAYDAYLRGIALSRDERKTMDERVKPLEEAVRLDPDFAVAWAMLVREYSYQYAIDATPDRLAAAHRSLNSALKLKSDLPEVQLAEAFFQYRVLRDYDAARRSFERVRPRLPNSADIPEALCWIAQRQGRWDERRVHNDEAVALNPRDRKLRREAASARVATRDFPAALRSYDDALNIWPDAESLIAGKAWVYQALGDLDQAETLVEQLRPTIEDMNGIEVICYQDTLRRRHHSTRQQTAIRLWQAWLDQKKSSSPSLRARARITIGDLQQFAGDTAAAKTSYEQARDEFEQMLKEQPANAHFICHALALTYAGLGDRERALTFVDRAVSLTPPSEAAAAAPNHEAIRARIAARFGMKDIAIPALEHLLKVRYTDPLTPALLRLDPDFDLLRDDPRFQKLVTEPGPKE